MEAGPTRIPDTASITASRRLVIGRVLVPTVRRRSCRAIVHVIPSGLVTGPTRAMGTAEEVLFGLNAVSHHLAPAVLAHRRQTVDGTLEAIEDMTLARGHHLERHLVFVTAHFACRHSLSSSVGGGRSQLPRRRRAGT